jgi:hypothetical protein
MPRVKDTLDQTKVTGIEPVDKAQDGVNNLVGGQFGKGGALQGVGDTFSKEGMNRAERGGKDDSVRIHILTTPQSTCKTNSTRDPTAAPSATQQAPPPAA